MADAGTLLVDRGDLPSLVAVTIDPRPDRLVLYHAREADAAASRRQAAVEEHGAAFGVTRVVTDQWPALEFDGLGHAALSPSHPPGGDDDLETACLLIRASAAARRLGCPRIVWPRQVGPDADRVGRLVEQAGLVTILAGPVIDLPLVDLGDEQIVDLAEDGGAPLHAFWPCSAGGAAPCETCDGCRRWRAAFDAVGAAWAWTKVKV